MTGVDPRIERSRRIVQEATIAEMSEVGYGAMTIEAIARRAGVSKATIYRHWTGKLDVVESALGAMTDGMELDENAPPRDRIEYLLTWLATYLSDDDNPSSACVPALVSAAHYDDAVREFHHRFANARRKVLVGIIGEGHHDGTISTDLDTSLTADQLVGPLFYRRLMTDTPFPPARVPALIDAVIGPA